MRRPSLHLLVLAALALAGCDKCGEPVKFNAPSLPNACHRAPNVK